MVGPPSARSCSWLFYFLSVLNPEFTKGVDMFILSNFLSASAQVLNVILTVLYWLILIRALISWVNPDPYNVIVQFLYKATEPILYPIRKILPLGLRSGIDISPIIAFLVIMFLKSFLIKSLIDLALMLR
jgi:YggT family protein